MTGSIEGRFRRSDCQEAGAIFGRDQVAGSFRRRAHRLVMLPPDLQGVLDTPPVLGEPSPRVGTAARPRAVAPGQLTQSVPKRLPCLE